MAKDIEKQLSPDTLNGENIIQFATNLDKFDKEETLKALENFSDFSNTVKESLNEYFSNVKDSHNVLKQNNEAFIKHCENEMNALISLLDNDLDASEKYEILDRIRGIRIDIIDHDNNDRMFILKELGMISAAVVAVAGGLASVLGGHTDFKFKWPKN